MGAGGGSRLSPSWASMGGGAFLLLSCKIYV